MADIDINKILDTLDKMQLDDAERVRKEAQIRMFLEKLKKPETNSEESNNG